MQRYPVLYGRSRKLKLRKRRITLFILVLLLLLIVGVGVNTVSFFNQMTDRDSWAASLKKGVEEGDSPNYLLVLLQGQEEQKELMSLYFISSHGDNPYSLLLPGNSSSQEGSRTFKAAYALQGILGVVEDFMEITGEPVHYYLVLEGALFETLGEKQDLRSRGPTAYYPVGPERGINRLVGEVRSWEREALTFAQELIGETPFWRWPALIKETRDLYETNLSWREITALMRAAPDYSLPAERQIHLPPGTWQGTEEGETPLYVVDPRGLETFLEYMRLGRSLRAREDIIVEVLNGSGVPGLARRTAEYLEGEGFTVVNVADADHFNYENTRVISRLDDVTPAKEVAVLIQGAQLLRETVPETEVMVTVILGKDFDLERVNR